MIPAPVPVFPIAVVLSAATAVFFYAAFLAHRGAGRTVGRPRQWRAGMIVAGAAVLLGAASSVFLAQVLTGHDRGYDQALRSVLAEQYGIHAGGGQLLKPGVPFPALLQGADAECTVSPPQTVVCDGAAVTPGAG